MNFGLDQNIIKTIARCLKTNPRIKEAILYGSRAQGNYRSGSDIDMTLKGERLTMQDIYQLHDQLDDLMTPYKFDLSIFNKINNPELLEHINRVGIKIYQK